MTLSDDTTPNDDLTDVNATNGATTVAPETSPDAEIVEAPSVQIDLHKPSLYINRELSQIEFNRRVLYEAQNQRHPLLERLKFVAIYASNMDEFFMVRVSGLKQQVLLGVTDYPSDGLAPREQLVTIHHTVTDLLDQQMEIYAELRKALDAQGIRILDYNDVKPRRKEKLRNYFEQEIFPVLTPLASDPGHPFPHISNLSLNLAVLIRDPDTMETHFARIKVPGTLPRLVPLKRFDPEGLKQPSTPKFVWVEHVIAANLDQLFPGMEIVAAYPFRITRNTDMEIQEEEADDLLMTIEDSLRQRHFGSVVRLEVDNKMPKTMRQLLTRHLKIDEQYDLYTIDGPLALGALWELHRLARPDLKDPMHRASIPIMLRSGESIFDTLKRQDVMLHRPFDSFAPVIDFIQEAAEDPEVLAIKMTLYRVGPNPPILHALMKARENGKQVAVLVELKARFDEESNIEWARALERAGVHVVYGLIGFKTHCKLALVIRRERGSGIRRYLHMSTGNYNANTARLYTDIDYMTSDAELGADASDIFNFLTGYSKKQDYQKFLVAPGTVRPRLMTLIAEEAARPNGHIMIKCNSLIDSKMIRALYRASQSGTKIECIVRGVCGLRPGVAGVSDNIRVVSIIGRFLEHSRVYYFANDGDPIVFVGSADLMPRNLDRRIEVLFPVEDEGIKQEIVEHSLRLPLEDNIQGHELLSDGSYVKLRPDADNGIEPFNSQEWLLNGRTQFQQPHSPDLP